MALQAQLYLEPGLPAPWTPALLGSGRGFTNTNGVQAVFLGYISAGKAKTGFWDHQGTHAVHSDLVWLGLFSLPGCVWT